MAAVPAAAAVEADQALEDVGAVRVLLVPVGGISKEKFMHYVKLCSGFSRFPLIDLNPAGVDDGMPCTLLGVAGRSGALLTAVACSLFSAVGS